MIKFDSLDEFFDYLPGHERMLVDQLREIIFECIPDVKEKLSYSVPYYYGKKRICYIWPSSVPWGNVKPNGVALGFCQGSLIEDELDYLEKEGRKSVLTKMFFSLDEINEDLIRRFLFQAHEIDQSH